MFITLFSSDVHIHHLGDRGMRSSQSCNNSLRISRHFNANKLLVRQECHEYADVFPDWGNKCFHCRKKLNNNSITAIYNILLGF